MLPDKKWLLVTILTVLVAGNSYASIKFTGKAYDLESHQYLYSEHYQCSDDFSTCKVHYVAEDGELIADKEIDFSHNAQSPALQIDDYRQKKSFGVESHSEPNLVVDAGFDNFVRKHWPGLMAGDAIHFKFLAVGRDKPLKVLMQRHDLDTCGTNELCLEISFESWLVRLMVDSIKLTYDRTERRLMRFRGISNLTNKHGGSQFVDIRYSYPAELYDVVGK